MLLYRATKFEGELISSDEGKVRWEDIDKLHTLKLANDMTDMLRIFTEDELSEFFYYEENGKWKYMLK